MSDGKAATITLGVASIAASIGTAITTSRAKGRDQREGISMMGLDPSNGEVVLKEAMFQWWPESLSDTITTGWTEKQIPGGSHSLQQWGGNGGRTISFEVILSRNLREKDDLGVLQGAGLGSGLVNPQNPRNLPFNYDITAGIRYLRAFCYPEYDDLGATAPPICLLHVPGHELNETGSDTLWCVMTGCDITYRHSFENGTPRLATAALTFVQVVQRPSTDTSSGVSYKQRSDLYSKFSEGPRTSREKNKPDTENP